MSFLKNKGDDILGDCNSCPSKENCGKSADTCMIADTNPNNKIKNVIGVMSGKGGVGKSTVSVMLAKRLREKGLKVGVLDADITGPSTARLFGINDKRAMGNEDVIFPVETEDGIKVMSLNFLIEEENQPVIWRGALLSNCVKQFWSDVLWEELDYLIIDMPPGTGDVTLTVMQSIPINGMVMVAVPQDMISMIVSKSINMAKKMDIQVYGIVENMSYIICPHCNEKIRIHDNKNMQKFLDENNVKLLGELPMVQEVGRIAEEGFNGISVDIINVFDNIINEIKV